MFFFTTPQSREIQPPVADPVVSAIREGAQKTGVGFDYLLKTAQRESALEPDARARTSSATGLFQFIEQTWLGLVKQEGAKQGLSGYASAISESESGRLTVADPATREKILQLRTDPQVSAVLAGALTQKNGEQLAAALGRPAHAGELYIAHVLGARGGSELIKAAGSDPGRIAARDFPEAAAANRSIFFDKSGRARSVQEVYGVLAASHANTQVAASTAAASTPSAAAAAQASQGADKPVLIAAGLAPGRARGLIGLFSTEGSREPVSRAVANLWTTPRAGDATRFASLDAGQRYFPRQKQADAVAPAQPAGAEVPAARTVRAPLPPSRPVELDQAAGAPALAQARPAGRTRRAPLDLSSFMTQRSGT